MNNIKKGSLMILALILFVLSSMKCKNDVSEYEVFFKKLDSKLSSEQKRIFKKCQDISCIKKFAFFSDSSFKEQFRNIPYGIEKTFDSLKIVDDEELVLLIAYHERINKREYSFNEIDNRIKLFYKNAEIEDIAWKTDFYGKLFRIAKTNFNKFNKGDTLSLTLPLSRDTDPPHVYFSTGYDKNNFTDTLFIKGVLLGKKERIDSLVWNNDIFFKLNVLFFSEPSYLIFGDSLKIGDDITISLVDYARIIP